MASSAEIVKPLPDTLPADFSEWDGGDVSPKVHLNEEAPSEPSRIYGAVDYEVLPMSSIPPALIHEADEGLFRSFGSNSASDEDQGRKSKKTMIAVTGAAGLILILLTVLLVLNPALFQGLFKGKQSVAPQSPTTDTETSTSARKPSPSTQLTNDGKPVQGETQSTATNAQAAIETDLTATTEDATASQVPSKMMNDQLAAPTRISRDIKTVEGKDAPANTGFGPGGMEGLGGGSGAIGSVFSKQGGPKVKADAPRMVKISAGVATGLLIQRSTPIYPPIAKASHTSGTVVLQATISKTGTIDHLRVVSGSAMLRQSAVDSVRSWRYKPYMLDNEPVEVETTINLIFSLGK